MLFCVKVLLFRCFSEGIFKVKGTEGALEFQSEHRWQFIDLSDSCVGHRGKDMCPRAQGHTIAVVHIKLFYLKNERYDLTQPEHSE